MTYIIYVYITTSYCGPFYGVCSLERIPGIYSQTWLPAKYLLEWFWVACVRRSFGASSLKCGAEHLI